MKRTTVLLASVTALALAGVLAGAQDTVPPGKAGTTTTTSAPSSKPAGIVNSICPILGGKVDPNAPAELTRMYKGHKVGFCCGGCPAEWDKLTDAQKDAKLREMMPASKPTDKHGAKGDYEGGAEPAHGAPK